MIADEGPTLPGLFGRYVLLKDLGRGAMGDVHLARPLNRNRGLPRLVVLKRLRGELVQKEAFVARFRHEATIAVSVNSPHVAKVYDVGSVGTALYIVMEYVAGWSLADLLDAVVKSGRHASIASVLDLVFGGLRGLDALHTAQDPHSGQPLGVVHRDLSPKNVMIGEDGELRLIDLGLGKSNIQDWRTRTGVVMGSVGYMPPEQARGERVDQRADVYAMGAMAFELLVLRNYVKRGSVSQMMEGSLNPRFVRPSQYRPDIPPGLDDLLRRALMPDPADRLASARAFLDALEAIVPASYTTGSMALLLDDLFGASREARARERRRIEALPDPQSDEFDTQPTKVFALGAGIEADTPPEVHTAATELSSRLPGGSSVRVRPVWPDPASMPAPRAPPRTVPVSVLAVSVGFAAVLGGALALSLRTMLPTNDPPSPAPGAPSISQREPVLEPPPIIAPPPLVHPPPVAEPPPPRRRPSKPPPRPTPPELPPPLVALDEALDALSQRVDAQRSAATGDRRRQLTALLVQIQQARASQDAARKKANLDALEARLRALKP